MTKTSFYLFIQLIISEKTKKQKINTNIANMK